MVLPGTRSRKRPSCGHALLGDVELGHHLDARQDRTVKALGNRPHRRLQHAIDAVLHVHRIVLRLDVNVAGAALDGGEDGRVDQPDDRAAVARQPFDGEIVVCKVIVFEDLDLKFLGRFVEHALGALALLQHALDGRTCPHHHADLRAEDDAELVDHRQVGRVRHDNHERLAIAPVRHEAVAQHQVRGNRPEQLLVDPEVVHVQEVEPIPIGEAARRGFLRAPLLGRHLRRRRFFDQRRRVERVVRSHIHRQGPFVITCCRSPRSAGTTASKAPARFPK